MHGQTFTDHHSDRFEPLWGHHIAEQLRSPTTDLEPGFVRSAVPRERRCFSSVHEWLVSW